MSPTVTPRHLPTAEDMRFVIHRFPLMQLAEVTDCLMLHVSRGRLHAADRAALTQLNDHAVLAYLLGGLEDGRADVQATVYQEGNLILLGFVEQQSPLWTLRHAGRIPALMQMILTAYAEDMPLTVDQLQGLGFSPADLGELLPVHYSQDWASLRETFLPLLDPKGLYRVRIDIDGVRLGTLSYRSAEAYGLLLDAPVRPGRELRLIQHSPLDLKQTVKLLGALPESFPAGLRYGL